MSKVPFLILLLFVSSTVWSEGNWKSNFVLVNGKLYFPGEQLEDGQSSEYRLKAFYVQKTEVTQAEWLSVMDSNPSVDKNSAFPVTSITWYEAIDYCNRLSQKFGLQPAYSVDGERVDWNRTANGFRLLTKLEWQHAADIAVLEGSFWHYDSRERIDESSWIKSNSGGGIHKVATRLPSSSGLYDLLGNVWEWCWDVAEPDPLIAPSSRLNKVVPDQRLLMGGYWNSPIDFDQILVVDDHNPRTSERVYGVRIGFNE